MNSAEMKNQEKKSNEVENDVTKKNKNQNYNNFEKDEKFQDNIITLQESIQKISKKIEEDKMNLRLLQERHIKKQSEYNELAGKPVIKSREQKVNEMKANMQKLKNHKIFDPNYGKKEPVLLPDEETRKIQKNTDKCKIELDNLTDAINKQVLYNTKLTHEIEEIRKKKEKKIKKNKKRKKMNQVMKKVMKIKVIKRMKMKKRKKKVKKVVKKKIKKRKKIKKEKKKIKKKIQGI